MPAMSRKFIVLCCVCGKRHDTNGDWSKFELPPVNDGETSYSHGVCPDCMRKIYGGEEWYQEYQKSLPEEPAT